MFVLFFVFVTTISSAKCDFFFFFFFSFSLPNLVHVSCCFLHTLEYITFTSLFSIVCAKTEQFTRFQRYTFKLVFFWCDKFLIRCHVRHLPVHLDCLSDAASGPCSISTADRFPGGGLVHCSSRSFGRLG